MINGVKRMMTKIVNNTAIENKIIVDKIKIVNKIKKMIRKVGKVIKERVNGIKMMTNKAIIV